MAAEKVPEKLPEVVAKLATREGQKRLRRVINSYKATLLPEPNRCANCGMKLSRAKGFPKSSQEFAAKRRACMIECAAYDLIKEVPHQAVPIDSPERKAIFLALMRAVRTHEATHSFYKAAELVKPKWCRHCHADVSDSENEDEAEDEDDDEDEADDGPAAASSA